MVAEEFHEGNSFHVTLARGWLDMQGTGGLQTVTSCLIVREAEADVCGMGSLLEVLTNRRTTIEGGRSDGGCARH